MTQINSSQTDWSIHYQATTVSQYHPAFNSPMSGPNSLSSNAEFENTFTTTLFLGRRLWENGELYFNPEAYAGSGFSNSTGVAGFPNGEVYRITSTELEPNLSRFYFKQVFGLGLGEQVIASNQNQIAGTLPTSRLTLILGKFSLSDFFDTNNYANDARSQFLNWSLMNNGAWDYAADAHGYIWGVLTEYSNPIWALRVALSMESLRSNTTTIDPNISSAHAINGEFVYRYNINHQAGNLRFLSYMNSADMGSYRTTLENPQFNLDLAQSRQYATKYGFGLNMDQSLSENIGVFARLGWNNGEFETIGFTEVDRTISGGINLSGNFWKRPHDVIGLALVSNWLSKDHADYLSAGGTGLMLGDGYLEYAPEQILETYYSFSFFNYFYITPDFQWINHPGYNAARGPVYVFSGRIHLQM